VASQPDKTEIQVTLADWPEDLPILETELELLETQLLDILSAMLRNE